MSSNNDEPLPLVIRDQLVLLERLEKKGALQLLIALLHRDFFITELISRRPTDNGIISQPTLEKRRKLLEDIGLIEEYEKFTPLTQKTRLYLRLTSKGKIVAEGAKALAATL